jgi:hypothetical protein
MYVCIMRQCFGIGTSYGSWLGLTIPAWGWDVTCFTPFLEAMLRLDNLRPGGALRWKAEDRRLGSQGVCCGKMAPPRL